MEVVAHDTILAPFTVKEMYDMTGDGAFMVLTVVGIFTAMIIFLRFLEQRDG